MIGYKKTDKTKNKKEKKKRRRRKEEKKRKPTTKKRRIGRTKFPQKNAATLEPYPKLHLHYLMPNPNQFFGVESFSHYLLVFG